MTLAESFRTIDRIRSVSAMRAAIARLDPKTQRSVIFLGLIHSRFQFTWSHFARDYGIPEEEWPAQNSGPPLGNPQDLPEKIDDDARYSRNP